MLVRALVCISGADAINVDDVVDMEDAEAIRHINAGHVVPVPSKIERAIKSAPEKRDGIIARAKKAITG
jgi:hypothetical protein